MKKLSLLGLVLVLGLFSTGFAQQYWGDNKLELEMAITVLKRELGIENPPTAEGVVNPSGWYDKSDLVDNRQKIELDEKIHPFIEIGDSLGELSQHFDSELIMAHGAAVFDANGDDLLDLYFPSVQRTIAYPSNERNVLQSETVPAKPSGLFLNQGNDSAGKPRYVSVQDLLTTGNKHYVREELLFEGKYKPRETLDDDAYAPGRVARGAVAADFNGDGKLDIYVLNGHFGVPYQVPEVGVPIYPTGTNIGRDVSEKPLLLRSARFMRKPIEQGQEVVVDYGDIPESEGRNTLYLNLGDRDNDGIPEWKDITNEAQIGGRWASMSAAIADYDRDGDLDMYVANFQDPDFYGFGATRFSGQPNQLYKNMLIETGELRFEDVAEALGVSGYHEKENLSSSMYLSNQGKEVEINDQYVEGKQVGEKADHSWAALFYDWNQDGWDDLVVANDMGNRLRIYKNVNGENFDYLPEFNDLKWEGCWMGMSRGDLDGDGREELLATNCGSQSLSIQNTRLFFKEGDMRERSIMANTAISYAKGINTLHHEVLQYSSEEGFKRIGKDVQVKHSQFLPPDQIMANNIVPEFISIYQQNNFSNSLTGIEFAFSAPMFDVDNDGDLDLYFVGALARGNDGHFGDFSGNPGRLLVNESSPGRFSFSDKTIEYQLLDMTDIDYSHNPPRRPSPGTGWHKRDYIYLTDTDSYSGMGELASKSVTHDLLKMHEHGSTVLPADLNNDGNIDLVVTHLAGYNSNSPNARNLKIEVMGRTLAVPGISKLTRPPTNYEYGKTFMYINSGPPKNKKGNWVKIALRDATSKNRFAIGSKIVINENIVRHIEATSGTIAGSVHQDLQVGLDDRELNSIQVEWSSGRRDRFMLENLAIVNQKVCIDRIEGLYPCQQLGEPLTMAKE